MKRASKEDLLKFKQSLFSNTLAIDEEITATVVEEDITEKPNQALTFIDKALAKEKLTVDEQIEYLKFKGITFNQCNESVSKDILVNRTYYYKVTAFRKNFKKDIANKYENVDFGLLNDLATIDMHFRYLFLKLSLDIEHNIKTLLIKLITESDEDGYKIVEEYKTFEIESYRKNLNKPGKRLTQEEIEKKISGYETLDKKLMASYKSPRDYSYDLINKRKNKPSIWVLIELMSYGELWAFINFYVEKKKYNSKELKLAKNLLRDSKNIRNASAHSRPILFNIVGPNQFLIKENEQPKLIIREYLMQHCRIPSSIVNSRTRNLKVHDISALLYLHNHYVKGQTTRIERKNELNSFLKRCILKKNYYDNHSELAEVFYMLRKIVKNYSVKN